MKIYEKNEKKEIINYLSSYIGLGNDERRVKLKQKIFYMPFRKKMYKLNLDWKTKSNNDRLVIYIIKKNKLSEQKKNKNKTHSIIDARICFVPFSLFFPSFLSKFQLV